MRSFIWSLCPSETLGWAAEKLQLMRKLEKVNRKLADFVLPKLINQKSSFKKGSPQSRPVITFPITHSQRSKKKNWRKGEEEESTTHGPGRSPREDADAPDFVSEEENNSKYGSASEDKGLKAPLQWYKNLSLRYLEKSKATVANYGTTAPLTFTLLESCSDKWLTHSDWNGLTRVTYRRILCSIEDRIYRKL